MSPKSLKLVRVVVHINEKNLESLSSNYQGGRAGGVRRDIAGRTKMPPSPPIIALQSLNDNPGFGNMKAEVLLIDDRSLQLNLLTTDDDDGPYTNISYKMHFDHIGNSAVDILKFELPMVMDDLLIKRKNSCIMRFSIKQDMDINVFFDILIACLNKGISHQKYKLQYVKLECLDIAAGLGNSKALPTEQGFAIRANLAGLDNIDSDYNNNETTFRLYNNAKNEFYSTRDLLVWLLGEYLYKFADNKGHEKLQFTFSITDHQHNIFRVKLSLFNIYLDLMNSEDRNHWHHYMDHMGDGCQGHDCNFMHSGLTISLSGHIEGIASQNTLLLFDVPTNIGLATDTIEMLQMAYSVIKNRKKKHLLLSKDNVNHRLSLASKDSTKCKFPSLEEPDNPLTNDKKDRRSLPSSKDEGKELNALSAWYRKIDESFAKVCQMRQKFFSFHFKLKTRQISSDIQHMFKSLESLPNKQTESELNEIQEDQIKLNELFEKYHDFYTLFRQILIDVKNTEFEEVLKVYFETKVLDLNNHAVVLKQKYLEFFQRHLRFTLSNLSSDIKLELEI